MYRFAHERKEPWVETHELSRLPERNLVLALYMAQREIAVLDRVDDMATHRLPTPQNIAWGLLSKTSTMHTHGFGNLTGPSRVISTGCVGAPS